MASAKPIPDGYQAVTANLIVDDGAKALDFYERLRWRGREPARGRRKGHALRAAHRRHDRHGQRRDARLRLRRPRPRRADLGVADDLHRGRDALHARALGAGATESNPVSDQFHGDRAGSRRDPFGHRWIATHTADVAHDELERRMIDFLAQSSS